MSAFVKARREAPSERLLTLEQPTAAPLALVDKPASCQDAPLALGRGARPLRPGPPARGQVPYDLKLSVKPSFVG